MLPESSTVRATHDATARVNFVKGVRFLHRNTAVHVIAASAFSIPFMACRVPFLPQHGNHKLEPQYMGNYSTGINGGRQFELYISRNPVPHTQSGSDSPLWYSVDVGPAHMIYLTNYDTFTEGSDQCTWLVNDLDK